jgi:enoyl-CoA hydratase/carnithine racemase
MSLTRERIGSVEWWTLDRPEKMNALDSGLIAGLIDAAAAARADAGIRVVVLTGSGSAFSAGADLDEARSALADRAGFKRMLESWRVAFRELELLPLPVLAAIDGVALAGGLELALSCDVIIASSRSRMGDAHIRYGLVPGGGGTQRLADAVGTRAARWLMYSGALLDAEAAQRLGLVQQVLPAEGFRDELQRLAAGIAERSSTALGFMKRMTRRGVSDLELQAELEGAVDIVSGPDARAGLDAFIAGATPVFSAERLV